MLGIPEPGYYGDFRMLTSQETIDLFGYPFDVVQWNNGAYYQIGPNTNPGQSVNVVRVLQPDSNYGNSFSVPSVAQSPFDVSPSDGDMRFEVSGFLGGGAAPPIPGIGGGGSVFGGSSLAPPPGASSNVVEGVSTALATNGGGPMQAGAMTPAGGVPWGMMFVVAVIVWAILAED
jgi:hypothetical protein